MSMPQLSNNLTYKAFSPIWKKWTGDENTHHIELKSICNGVEIEVKIYPNENNEYEFDFSQLMRPHFEDIEPSLALNSQVWNFTYINSQSNFRDIRIIGVEKRTVPINFNFLNVEIKGLRAVKTPERPEEHYTTPLATENETGQELSITRQHGLEPLISSTNKPYCGYLVEFYTRHGEFMHFVFPKRANIKVDSKISGIIERATNGARKNLNALKGSTTETFILEGRCPKEKAYLVRELGSSLYVRLLKTYSSNLPPLESDWIRIHPKGNHNYNDENNVINFTVAFQHNPLHDNNL